MYSVYEFIINKINISERRSKQATDRRDAGRVERQLVAGEAVVSPRVGEHFGTERRQVEAVQRTRRSLHFRGVVVVAAVGESGVDRRLAHLGTARLRVVVSTRRRNKMASN